MLSEILKVIPKIDPADAAKMASTLSKSTANVGKTFSRGLKASLSGGFAGWGTQLLNKILNPVEDIEKRMREIMHEGTSAVESAERFGTTAGELQRAKAGAAQLGVTPERFSQLLESYSKTIETARQELADPTATPSAGTLAVREFIGEENLLKSFQSFMQAQAAIASGPGRTASFGEDGAVKRHQSGKDSQAQIQQAVFGERLRGSSAQLGSLGDTVGRLGGPSADSLTKALGNEAAGNQKVEAAAAMQDLKFIVDRQTAMNEKTFDLLIKRDEAEQKKELAQFQRFEVLASAAQDVQALKNAAERALEVGTEVVGLLGKVVKVADAWATSSGVAGWIGQKFKDGMNAAKGAF